MQTVSWDWSHLKILWIFEPIPKSVVYLPGPAVGKGNHGSSSEHCDCRARRLVSAAVRSVAVMGGVLGITLAAMPAAAGVLDWQISEVVSSVGGDRELRFVELYAEPGTKDNCFFSSSRLEIFDAAGNLLGSVTPFQTTQCYQGETYFLFATPEAEGHFSVARDAPLTVRLPAHGQVCFKSSNTRYDCMRWGTIAKAVVDLTDAQDESTAPALPDGAGLSRTARTGIVADDFEVRTPTPRQPNNGTVWIPPDAGPDARPPDAALPDAPPSDARPDARPYVPPDARPPLPSWPNADPGGGVAITCQIGPGRQVAGEGWPLGLGGLLAWAWWRRRPVA